MSGWWGWLVFGGWQVGGNWGCASVIDTYDNLARQMLRTIERLHIRLRALNRQALPMPMTSYSSSPVGMPLSGSVITKAHLHLGQVP